MKLKNLRKDRKGHSTPLTIALILGLLLLICAMAEFFRLAIIVQGMRSLRLRWKYAQDQPIYPSFSKLRSMQSLFSKNVWTRRKFQDIIELGKYSEMGI